MRIGKAVVAVLLLTFLSFQGSAMAHGIVDDLKEIRQQDKAAIIDVSATVGKYIAIGQKKGDVEAYLLDQEFVLNFLSSASASRGSQTLVATREANGLPGIGFHDEIRVVVIFGQGSVKSRTGKLIYRAL